MIPHANARGRIAYTVWSGGVHRAIIQPRFAGTLARVAHRANAQAAVSASSPKTVDQSSAMLITVQDRSLARASASSATLV